MLSAGLVYVLTQFNCFPFSEIFHMYVYNRSIGTYVQSVYRNMYCTGGGGAIETCTVRGGGGGGYRSVCCGGIGTCTVVQ